MKYALFAVLLGATLAAQTHPVLEFKTEKGPLKLTAIRHASLMIAAGGQVVHVDPWSQGNYAGVPQADLILITDVHGDHMDPKALTVVRKASSVVIAPAAVAQQVQGAKALANGESTTAGPFRIEALPMYNLQRGPEPGKVFHEKGRGNGYVLTYGGFRLYVSGDTEGVPEMRTLKNIDVALICMNLPYTMTPEEAADAVKAFHPKVAIPYHYRQSNTKTFAELLAGSGVEVKLLDWYH
jgi:L-ascorbate metabolism protein UlaG (beta-lactamase superfamily)